MVGLTDGESVHCQCSFTPINDPDLRVIWKKDGKEISNSNRLKTVADFGFASLDISNVDSRDSGKYSCVIKNLYVIQHDHTFMRSIGFLGISINNPFHSFLFSSYGQDHTECTLQCKGVSGVFYEELRTKNLQKTQLKKRPGI